MQKETTTRKHIGFRFTRRLFLRLSLWFSGLVSGWGIFQFLSYEPPGEIFLPSITLFEPFTFQIGSVTYIPEVKAWLARDQDGFYALSATCTHLGCTINKKEAGQFLCPCHGSQFDLSGRVLHGPAVNPLPNFEVSLSEDGRVVIDRRVIVPPTQKLKL